MIKDAVVYDEVDYKLVQEFDALPVSGKKGNYWTNDTIKLLKSKVKAHYIKVQKNRCCYCNRKTLSENHNHWNIEHIVPKAKYPRFMFTPINLAASCIDCNIAKDEQQVLTKPNLVKYPKDSNGFKIIHPHFDEHQDHIEVIELVYIGKTDKGCETIYMCKLLRFAAKYIDWQNSPSDTRFEEAVDSVFSEDAGSLKAVTDVIEQLPEK